MTENNTNCEELQMIVFRLGKEEYAVTITSVQEIIMDQQTTKMPKTQEFVEGVINLRGKIIPVIDGRKKFQINSSQSAHPVDKRVIILDIEQEIIGLVVDEVSEVLQIKTKDIDQTPIKNNDDDCLILGVAKHNGRLLILLNPIEFLNPNEVHSLKNITHGMKIPA